jgi:hypothetical protein
MVTKKPSSSLMSAPIKLELGFEFLSMQRGSLADLSKLAGGVQPRHPPPGSLLPQRFSGRHFLELMVDFATNRSEKLVKFVLYR